MYRKKDFYNIKFQVVEEQFKRLKYNLNLTKVKFG